MKVLVVDDDAPLRRALARVLRTEGHEVVTVENAAAALEACARAAFDVLVLDYGLPDATGLDVLAELHASPRPPPATLIVTGQTLGPRMRQAASRRGARVLRKPVSVSELLSGIRRALRPRLA